MTLSEILTELRGLFNGFSYLFKDFPYVEVLKILFFISIISIIGVLIFCAIKSYQKEQMEKNFKNIVFYKYASFFSKKEKQTFFEKNTMKII